jgi:competence protein ComEC
LKRWLEHDGDARSAREAARGDAFACDGSGCTGFVKGVRVAVATHPSALADDCKSAGILVATVTVPDGCKGPRVVLDWRTVKREGTHALYVEPTGEIRVVTVAQTRGDRPWAPRTTKFRPSGSRSSERSLGGNDGLAINSGG